LADSAADALIAMANVMVLNKEIELKFEIEPSILRLLHKIPSIKALNKAPKLTTETSVYFDTNGHKLRQRGLLLRVRRIGRRHIQTIKVTSNSIPIERSEWQTEISGVKPDLRVIDNTPLSKLITKKIRGRLKPIFETRIRRTAYSLNDKKHAIELTFDRGRLDTGDRSIPICELELELKRGSKDKLFEIARSLTRALPAQISLKSKAERGYELIAGSKDLPVKTIAVDLPTACNACAGFSVIGFGCLKQILDNVPALAKTDPEGVHQMRVGVRRLRAAMSLFGDLLHDAQAAANIKTELKWLAKELTPAREFEVLSERVMAPLKKRRGISRYGLRLFSTALARKHNSALAQAKDAVGSARFGKLVFEVASWLEHGRWREPEDDLTRSRSELPIEIFASEQMRRRYRRVRKRGKKLGQLSAQDRHKLRIQVKKLRYGAEFFGQLFQSKKAVRRQNKFASALKQLQKGLGDLNDIAVDERLIGSLGPPSSAFAAGLLTGHEEARESEAMAAAIQGYTKLVKVKPFWR
jgi:inorganic triphosphatase YgiF